MQKNSDSDLYDLISFLATDGAETDHADAFTSSPLTGSEHPAITGIDNYQSYHTYQRTFTAIIRFRA